MSFFHFFRPKKTHPTNTERFKFTIKDMHCTACAMNIDNTLEELPGVLSSKTNYAKSETIVQATTGAISEAQLRKAIKDAGYEAE